MYIVQRWQAIGQARQLTVSYPGHIELRTIITLLLLGAEFEDSFRLEGVMVFLDESAGR